MLLTIPASVTLFMGKHGVFMYEEAEQTGIMAKRQTTNEVGMAMQRRKDMVEDKWSRRESLFVLDKSKSTGSRSRADGRGQLRSHTEGGGVKSR